MPTNLLFPLLAVLGLTSCATPSEPPSEYGRGTPARPPPAPVRPVVGAPTYDPEAPAERQEPTLRTPALPPRPAPTIWAGPSTPHVLRPVLGWWPPKQLDGGPENDALPAYCSEVANAQIAAITDPQFEGDLEERTRRCFAATVWAQCMEAFLLDFDKARRRDKERQRLGLPLEAFWDYKRIRTHVQSLVRAECDGVANFDKYRWQGP